MKCKTTERWIVLEGSGELSARRQRRLAAHLVQCEGCRQWREACDVIETRARDVLVNGEPSETVLANIRREARVRATDKRPTVWLAPWMRPVYGLAALCVVLIGGWWMRPDPEVFGGEAQLQTILLMLSDETNMFAQVSSTLSDEAVGQTALETLAQDLLLLQGLDEEYTDAELRDPGEEPLATDPLSRSSFVPQAKRYV